MEPEKAVTKELFSDVFIRSFVRALIESAGALAPPTLEEPSEQLLQKPIVNENQNLSKLLQPQMPQYQLPSLLSLATSTTLPPLPPIQQVRGPSVRTTQMVPNNQMQRPMGNPFGQGRPQSLPMQKPQSVQLPPLPPPSPPSTDKKKDAKLVPEADLGKIASFLNDPSVLSVECPGPGKNILVNRSGAVQSTAVALIKDEIDKIINEISDKTRIPVVQGLFKAAYRDMLVTAVVSDFIGTRFLIQKRNPFL